MIELRRRKVIITHHRVSIGNPIKEVRRVMFDKPRQVTIGCIMFDSNNQPSYSGIDTTTFTGYTFEQEDILSMHQLTEAGYTQLDSTEEGIRRLLGLVSNVALGQQDIRNKLSEYQQTTALSPTKDQDSTVELHLLQTTVSALTKGIEEQSKQITAMQQQLQAIEQRPQPQATSGLKSLLSFFSTQTKANSQ